MPDLEPTLPSTSVPSEPGANGPSPLPGPPGDRPKPRGLLPVPPEVIQHVDAYLNSLETHGMVATPEQRDRIIHDLTLQWHYGGDVVVIRESPQGYEVLASGDEVWEFLRTTPEEQKRGVKVHTLSPWGMLQL